MATQLTDSHYFLPFHELFFAAAPKARRHHFHILHRCRLPSAIYASSLNNSRAIGRKKVRSNADLCNDLLEFVSEVGLPEGHVPSMKELSEHGRQDLANIVRRRGYKLIRELLAASRGTTVLASDVKQDNTTTAADEPTGQHENVKELAEDVLFFSSGAPIVEEKSISKSYDDDSSSNIENTNIDSSTENSLQDKVAKFIHSGELEAIEDYGLDLTNENVADNEKESTESQSSSELELSSASGDQSGQVSSLSDSANVVNGSASSPLVRTAFEKDTLRKISSNDQLATAESTDTDKDVDFETRTTEDQAEVNRIKFMLHQKELELSHLKEQIEKEKQALSELQAKAETEISKAQKLLLDKDAELHAAEESLSGLKQVQIEYWGDGESVEVAGSFNGWHHGVILDPQPSSNITDPIELRTCRLWRSILWLYPGIYEIKFIVDGKWMVDPTKEMVTRGTVQNNILRVDR